MPSPAAPAEADAAPPQQMESVVVVVANGAASRTHTPPPPPPSPPLSQEPRPLGGASVAFCNVGVTVGGGRGRAAKSTPRRTLLSGVTGCIAPGCLAALMGPSGAGKTTLLDVASRRKNTGAVTGCVLLDGALPSHAQLRSWSAYVQQEDALFGLATIEETLAFAAEFKLAGRCALDKAAAVELCLSTMGLEAARAIKVGNRMVRGASGGERKRTAIACGLLGSPRIVFIDEPTSGLDSSTAAGVVFALSRLVSSGAVTVLATIHQPAPPVFRLFDDLLLLKAGGEVCFFGPRPDAALFFASLGYSKPPEEPDMSDPDFLLLVVSSQQPPQLPGGAPSLPAAFARTPLAAAQAAAADAARDGRHMQLQPSPRGGRGGGACGAHANSMRREVALLCALRNLPRYRSPVYMFAHAYLFVVIGLVFASFFYSTNLDFEGIAATTSILFLSVSTPTFMASSFVADLTLERLVYTREFNDGYYRASSYVIAKVASNLPALALSALLYACVVYPSVGLRFGSGGDGFFFFALANFVNLVVAMLSGFAVTSLLPGEVAPLVLLPSWATIHVLASGFLIPRGALPRLWRWLYTCSYEQHLWAALMINQFAGQSYAQYCRGGTTIAALSRLLPSTAPPVDQQGLAFASAASGVSGCVDIQGADILHLFQLDRGVNRWASIGYAALTSVILFALFYVGVRTVRHERR